MPSTLQKKKKMKGKTTNDKAKLLKVPAQKAKKGKKKRARKN